MDLFDYAERYPLYPGFKTGGTSLEAAEKVAPGAASLRARVLKCLLEHPDGLTADEIATAIGRSPLGVRPRLSELLRLDAIKESGARRINESGMTANVWVVTWPQSSKAP